MSKAKLEAIRALREIVSVQQEALKKDKSLDTKVKSAMELHANQTLTLSEEPMTATQIKSLTNDLLIYWNESIGQINEQFWAELQKRDLNIERKDPLASALRNGRFRRVDQGMAARSCWAKLKHEESIKKRFSTDDILNIGKIIEGDEERRLRLLKKCLKKQSIAKSDYLMFGDSMAYFDYCGLFNQNFSEEELDQLYQIWEKH